MGNIIEMVTGRGRGKKSKAQTTSPVGTKFHFAVDYSLIVKNKTVDTIKCEVDALTEEEASSVSREVAEKKYEKEITEQSAHVVYTGKFSQTTIKE